MCFCSALWGLRIKDRDKLSVNKERFHSEAVARWAPRAVQPDPPGPRVADTVPKEAASCSPVTTLLTHDHCPHWGALAETKRKAREARGSSLSVPVARCQPLMKGVRGGMLDPEPLWRRPRFATGRVGRSREMSHAPLSLHGAEIVKPGS